MNKRDVAERLLAEGTIFVRLNPRGAHVVVPPWFKHQDDLALSFGLNMPIPIPDLRVDQDGIFGTLRFSGTSYVCFVPWSAVFCITGDSGRGMVWFEDMPPSVAALVEKEVARTKAPLRSVPNCGTRRGPPRRGHLRLVGGGSDERGGSGTYPTAS